MEGNRFRNAGRGERKRKAGLQKCKENEWCMSKGRMERRESRIVKPEEGIRGGGGGGDMCWSRWGIGRKERDGVQRELTSNYRIQCWDIKVIKVIDITGRKPPVREILSTTTLCLLSPSLC